jgi:hypothetical protein
MTSTSIKRLALAAVSATALCLATTQLSEAAAVRPGLFNSNTLPANDDGFTGLVDIGFNANFAGTTYSQLFVNNNGNVTFDGSLSTFTPFVISGAATKIIAPFFADVDTRGFGSGVVTYGTGTVGGRNAFGVNWPGVGYFRNGTDKLNTFQLVLIDRSDVGAGNFDIEFNYDQIQWETGDASNGSGGLGGFSARVGYSDGSGNFFELPGSGVNGAFLDGGSNSLTANRLNSTEDGRYIFSVRGGAVNPIPTPALLPGLIGMGIAAWRKRKAATPA